MVEPKQQPQDLLESPGDEGVNALIESVEQLYSKSSRLFETHITDFETFKEAVSKKIMSICTNIDELKAMFTDFDTVQRKKTNSKMVISNLETLLQTAFKFNAQIIIDSIQQDIQAAKLQLKRHNESKQKKIRNIIKECMVDFDRSSIKPVSLATLKGVRRLPNFGFVEHISKVDFEWPKESDLLYPMTDGQPLQIASIDWQSENSFITGV